MKNQDKNNIKLGVFVLTGLLALIFSFYMIGKNHNLFGSNFELKVHFTNLNGLTEGNNVLFSGIQAGTVKSVTLINDTDIEVSLMIDNKVRTHIHKNATASIGTEGLMGNKVVNIIPQPSASPKVDRGDLLTAKKIVNTGDMLQTLSQTNNNAALISESLKKTAFRIDSSALLSLLNDKSIGAELKSSLKNINRTAANANKLSQGLNEIILQIRQGKGAAGVLLSDSSAAGNLRQAIVKLRSAGENVDEITSQLNKMVMDIKQDIHKKGPLNTLLRDSLMAKNLSLSMDNIQKGTDGFNQNMEALKHNFLFSGYFKRLEKQKKKEQEVLLKQQAKALQK